MITIPESFSIALHSLLLLADKPGAYQSGKRIAETCRFSQHHLAKVLAALVHAGLLDSQRGPSGGVCLARTPEDITLATIRDAVEGRAIPRKGCLLLREVCPGKRCAVGCFLATMEAEFERIFKTTTLADVLRSTHMKGKTK